MIFKPVTYPGIMPNTYYVSEYGDVNIGMHHLLYSHINTYGYLSVTLRDENNRSTYLYIARMVAYEFCLKNRNISLQVDHIDGNKLNNHYTNLEWVTNAENMRRAYVNHLTSTTSYKTEDQIRKLCWLLANTDMNYLPACNEAGILDVNENQAKGLCIDIIKGKYWCRISKDFDFSERLKLWRRNLSVDDKDFLRNQIESGISTDKIYKNFYEKDWKDADRKDRDNFRHILNRLR